METIINKEDLEEMFTPQMNTEIKVVLNDGTEKDFESLRFKYTGIKEPEKEAGTLGGMFG